MWLSNGDLCRLMDACLTAPLKERFLVVNGMSANAGMRWDIDSGARRHRVHSAGRLPPGRR